MPIPFLVEILPKSLEVELTVVITVFFPHLSQKATTRGPPNAPLLMPTPRLIMEVTEAPPSPFMRCVLMVLLAIAADIRTVPLANTKKKSVTNKNEHVPWHAFMPDMKI